ncbi:adenine phosphoribosyltransferase [Verrucomicrobium sp. GAS474]|uniref:adenine phosphoribosyltransferase n=1 Tax=Verrucomicrobium sp. GAS474 TaxID=1882831 RepID=UPI00087D9F14|nr:adenine phosphoribosyltransferase [Verrucomicrobium sp. GAS474]SDU15773.1 adenine phosphoribosyltransferase [Verrucomicrobium sp. GAS474]
MNLSFRSGIGRLKENIRTVPDFPTPGVTFRDISPILADGQLLRLAITLFTDRYQRKSIDKIVAVDARGFILGGAIANVLGIGMIPIRKKGKLPPPYLEASYDLEYGSATLTLLDGAVQPGERVVIFDDVLATGGTAAAAAKLVTEAGGNLIELAFLVELSALHGREKLKGHTIHSAIIY